MIGDVWLCSGQSNMKLDMRSAETGPREIPEADNPDIRLYKVPDQVAEEPISLVRGTWRNCTPQTVREFSAVAYFFGRDIYKAERVPIGLIQAAWVGTYAESWMDLSVLKADKEFHPVLESYQKMESGYSELKARMDSVLGEFFFPNREEDALSRNWHALNFDDSQWKTISLPSTLAVRWRTKCPELDIDGIIWFRKGIHIPEGFEVQEAVLHLGNIMVWDTTYVNGKLAGRMGPEVRKSLTLSRRYKLRPDLLKAGSNVVSLRLFNRKTLGGFYGRNKDMRLVLYGHNRRLVIPLDGEWKYCVEIETAIDWKALQERLPRTPSSGPMGRNRPSGLYNAMIHPLIPYALRGVVWYQGESNVLRHHQYGKVFSALIQTWRKAWGQGDFPFIFVQLPNFEGERYFNLKPGAENWVIVRDAQLKTLMTVPNTGMAVTIDIGESNDIHPKNKRDVGKRLALAALGIAYERDIVYSGPMYDSMGIEGSKVRIRFNHVGAGLVARGEELNGFAMAGEGKKFVKAEAVIDGDTVVVSSPQIEKPVAVRYGWAPDPVCNLYNREDLPASPFRTE